MKKKYLLILMLLLFPFIANADTLSVSVSCKSVTVGQQTSCDVYVTPSSVVQSIYGTYSISGNNVSLVNITSSGAFQGDIANGRIQLYGNSYNSQVKLFTVYLNTNSIGDSRFNVSIEEFGGSEDKDYPGSSANGTISVKAPETQPTTQQTQQTREKVTNSTQATIATTTQTTEAVTQSSLYLTGITVDDYEVKEEEGIYYVTIDSNKDSVEINATAPEGIVISGLGKRNIAYGKNTINLTLTDPTGASKNVQLVITRPDLGDKNTLLKELEVINYKLDFDPNTMEYTITVPYNVKDVYVYAVAQSADTSIKGSGKYELKDGETNAFVTVSYGDIASSTYTIHIKKSYLGLLPIIILSIGLICTTGGLFFLSNKLKEKEEELVNSHIANKANMERAIEDQGPQLSINGESATGIGARVVKPQSVQTANIKIVNARPTTTQGIVPPTTSTDERTPSPQVKVVKKVIISSTNNNTINQVDTNTSEV